MTVRRGYFTKTTVPASNARSIYRIRSGASNLTLNLTVDDWYMVDSSTADHKYPSGDGPDSETIQNNGYDDLTEIDAVLPTSFNNAGSWHLP